MGLIWNWALQLKLFTIKKEFVKKKSFCFYLVDLRWVRELIIYLFFWFKINSKIYDEFRLILLKVINILENNFHQQPRIFTLN